MSEGTPFTIQTLDTYGRVLVAARDISPWELVIDDTCLVVAPNDVPVCLGCLGQVTPTGVHPCSGCGWPMCSDQCHNSDDHATECKLFSEKGVNPKFENYSDKQWLYTAVAILRMLLLKQVCSVRLFSYLHCPLVRMIRVNGRRWSV